ncbi:Phospholipase, variant 2 [Balamuthia mandrillaris]
MFSVRAKDLPPQGEVSWPLLEELLQREERPPFVPEELWALEEAVEFTTQLNSPPAAARKQKKSLLLSSQQHGEALRQSIAGGLSVTSRRVARWNDTTVSVKVLRITEERAERAKHMISRLKTIRHAHLVAIEGIVISQPEEELLQLTPRTTAGGEAGVSATPAEAVSGATAAAIAGGETPSCPTPSSSFAVSTLAPSPSTRTRTYDSFEVLLLNEHLTDMVDTDSLLKSDSELPLLVRMQMASACANGMNALHRNGLCHGDLSLENFMVNQETKQFKICNYAIARMLPIEQDPYHMAPELDDNGMIGSGTLNRSSDNRSSESENDGKETSSKKDEQDTEERYQKADVYSFGVLLFELLAGVRVKDLFKGTKEDFKRTYQQRGLAYELPQDFTADTMLKGEEEEEGNPEAKRLLLDLVRECLQQRSELRPSFGRICKSLNELLPQILIQDKYAKSVWMDALQVQTAKFANGRSTTTTEESKIKKRKKRKSTKADTEGKHADSTNGNDAKGEEERASKNKSKTKHNTKKRSKESKKQKTKKRHSSHHKSERKRKHDSDQYLDDESGMPFIVEWDSFYQAFYVQHLGEPPLKPHQIPPEKGDPKLSNILALMMMHELLAEWDLKGTLSLPPKELEKRFKHKRNLKDFENVVLIKSELVGSVYLLKYLQFLKWFPMSPPRDPDIMRDVFSIMGHPFFQVIKSQEEAKLLLSGHKRGTFLFRFSSRPGEFAVSWIAKVEEKKEGKKTRLTTHITNVRFTREIDEESKSALVAPALTANQKLLNLISNHHYANPTGRRTLRFKYNSRIYNSFEELHKQLKMEKAFLQKPYKAKNSLEHLKLVWKNHISMIAAAGEDLSAAQASTNGQMTRGHSASFSNQSLIPSSLGSTAPKSPRGGKESTITAASQQLFGPGRTIPPSVQKLLEQEDVIGPSSLMNPSLNSLSSKELVQKDLSPFSVSIGYEPLIYVQNKKGNLLLKENGSYVEKYAEVLEGFIVIYDEPRHNTPRKKRSSDDEDDESNSPPTRTVKEVIALEGTTVERIIKNEKAFLLDSPTFTLEFCTSSLMKSTKWAAALRYWANPRNKYNSFAAPRSDSLAEWYVDGKATFLAIKRAIEGAQERVFITDWWMVPDIYMQRDPPVSADDRLDRLMLTKARQGIKFFILLWREPEIVMELGSISTKKRLMRLHPNIKVLTHPMYKGPIPPNSWSHHQKSLVVDYGTDRIKAFLGGLDLCFGRWDEHNHSVTDDCHLAYRWPGKDYHNPAEEATTFKQPYVNTLDRDTIPRMPWHDIHMSISGEAAIDVAHNFIQRWNHHRAAYSKKKLQAFDIGFILPIPNPFRDVDGNLLQVTSKATPPKEEMTFLEKIKFKTEKQKEDRELKKKIRKQQKEWVREQKEKDTPSTEEKPARRWKPKISTKKDKTETALEPGDDAAPSSKEHGREIESEQAAETASSDGQSVEHRAPTIQADESLQPGKDSVEKRRPWKRKKKDKDGLEPSQSPLITPQDSTVIGAEEDQSQTNGEEEKGAFMATPEFTSSGEKEPQKKKKWKLDKEQMRKRIKDIRHHHSDDAKEGSKMSDAAASEDDSSEEEGFRDKIKKTLHISDGARIERDKVAKKIRRPKLPFSQESPPISCHAQILRSISPWSGGHRVESSIQNAYVDLITRAEHFIYIENQYFISDTAKGPSNAIASALLRRVVRAIEEEKPFHVVVVLPVHPDASFETMETRFIMKLQFDTIVRGPDSILGFLQDNYGLTAGAVRQYISFHALRNHGELLNGAVTHQVYVHTKTMIVDDKYAIIGSANINDRRLVECCFGSFV